MGGSCIAFGGRFVSRVPARAQLPHRFAQSRCGSLPASLLSSAAVIIYFLETEPAEWPFFADGLAGHEVQFASGPEDVEGDAEVVSTFIYSGITPEFIAAHPRLRLIATRSTAVD